MVTKYSNIMGVILIQTTSEGKEKQLESSFELAERTLPVQYQKDMSKEDLMIGINLQVQRTHKW